MEAPTGDGSEVEARGCACIFFHCHVLVSIESAPAKAICASQTFAAKTSWPEELDTCGVPIECVRSDSVTVLQTWSTSRDQSIATWAKMAGPFWQYWLRQHIACIPQAPCSAEAVLRAPEERPVCIGEPSQQFGMEVPKPQRNFSSTGLLMIFICRNVKMVVSCECHCAYG